VYDLVSETGDKYTLQPKILVGMIVVSRECIMLSNIIGLETYT
jgi:hypothetical protein